MFRIFFTWAALALFSLAAAGQKIAVLHPLLGDMARHLAGDKIEVIDLIGPNGDPHHFEPKPEDLKRAEGATLYLVAGLGLEGYLPKLKAIIPSNAKVIEVGATLPVMEGTAHECHEGHNHDTDPHWWHSIQLFGRATNVVADTLGTAFPEDAEFIKKNATDYRAQLENLERWVKREVSKIPRNRRHLATAHAAFNYFCKDFGFTAHPIQGLNREQMPDPKELAALVVELKTNEVAAIFPEKESNPKILQTLTHDTGIRLGEPLIADGVGVKSYDEMVRHNVTAIIKALAR
jgi:zinc/manganese transport system substrate-binding protein